MKGPWNEKGKRDMTMLISRAVHTFTERDTKCVFGVLHDTWVSDTETCLPRFNGGGKERVVVMVMVMVMVMVKVKVKMMMMMMAMMMIMY